MSALTSLARARAFETGRAVPIATRRHVYLSDRPLAFVPLSLAGEANAPLACLVGSSFESPTLLVVPQPRNRDLRFAFAASLASVVLDYVESFTVSMETVRDKNVFTDAPQLLVANPAGVAFTRLLGRSTRLRRTEGEYAVDPSVPLLGRWLTYFAERTEHPVRWPPAGPTTDPSFDNEVLAPLVRSYDAASSSDDAAARDRALAKLESALRSQMEPTWRLMCCDRSSRSGRATRFGSRSVQR